MAKNWKNKKVVILGLSKTGEATAKYLVKKGASCIISEKRQSTEKDNQKIQELNTLGIFVEMGGNNPETIKNADLIVTSPGIPPYTALIKGIRENNKELISEPELAYRETTTPIVAITGTNGKSTTTSLVSAIFKENNLKAPLCGNIGFPVIGELEKSPDYLIAEISSFQLEYSPTLKPRIAAFLNYTPDHIDWHGNEQEYLKAKSGFLTNNRSPEWVVLNATDDTVAQISKGSKSNIFWFGRDEGNYCCFIKDESFIVKENNIETKILPVNEVKLKGLHNYQNIMAGITIARIAKIPLNIIVKAVREFESIEHRLEFTATIDNISFYNDSKATNCDSTICALRAFGNERIVLIAGGRDKGTNLSELVMEIKNHTNSTILIGEAADRFEQALRLAHYNNIYREDSLEGAIEKAFSLKQGPVVLSPACASYDMFKNFEERGNVFKDIVHKKRVQLEKR